MRLGQGDAQQVRALVHFGLQHAQAAVELVMPGRKAQLAREVVEPAVKRGRVVRAGPFVEQRGRERGGAVLARRVERAPPANAKRSVTTGIE